MDHKPVIPPTFPLTINCDVQRLNLIITALVKLPYEMVDSTVQDLRTQADLQVMQWLQGQQKCAAENKKRDEGNGAE